MSVFSIYNENDTVLVAVVHTLSDTLQVFGVRYDISPGERVVIPSQSSSVNVHVFRLGLFGLISPRTRLTSGYGFRLELGCFYRLQQCNPDENGNICTFLREVPGTSKRENVQHINYQFGDMLLRPTFNIFSGALRSVDPNSYQNYLASQTRRIRYSFEDSVATRSPLPAPPHLLDLRLIDPPEIMNENEMWGVFFEQVYAAGIWGLHYGHLITLDDIEIQEPFIYIGLPSISLFNLVTRARDDTEALTMIDGRRVSTETCPPTYKELFQMLLATKSSLQRLDPAMSEVEVRWVKQVLLYAGSDHAIGGK
jgi:hypothetical protein